MDETRIPFEDGETVVFSDLKGMTELNGQQRKIKILGPYTFSIEDDTTSYHRYITGGYVTQVKLPRTLTFVN